MARVKSKPRALSSVVPALAKVARTGHPFCGYCRRNQNPGPPADVTTKRPQKLKRRSTKSRQSATLLLPTKQLHRAYRDHEDCTRSVASKVATYPRTDGTHPALV